jgi:hypothetical protein
MCRCYHPESLIDKIEADGGFVTVLDFAGWDIAKSKLNDIGKKCADECNYVIASKNPLHVEMYMTGQKITDTNSWNGVYATFVKEHCSMIALPFKCDGNLDEQELETEAAWMLKCIVNCCTTLPESEMRVLMSSNTTSVYDAMERAVQLSCAE